VRYPTERCQASISARQSRFLFAEMPATGPLKPIYP